MSILPPQNGILGGVEVTVVNSMSLQTSLNMEGQEYLECVHYWVIDVPSGPVSKGRCRLCGESAEFSNYLETGSAWDDDRSSSQASSAGRAALGQPGGIVSRSEEEEEE